jgi:hypothetical protein
MQIPVIHGTIERRILINYGVDPDVLQALLPAPFRPKLVRGFGIAGVCLIRLRNVRPKFWPAALGARSENAAHRIAVEWEDRGVTREDVFVPRRDTNCRFNSLVGGRMFPGVHQHAKFDVLEGDNACDIHIQSDDGETEISVRGRQAGELPPTSLFESIDEISAFFERGSVGYSPSLKSAELQGLELHCRKWQVRPLAVAEVRSSFFDDPGRFPAGSIEFDSALVMRGIEHEWRSLGNIKAAERDRFSRCPTC